MPFTLTETPPDPLTRPRTEPDTMRLVCLGTSYSARALLRRLRGQAMSVTGTTRSEERADALCRRGVRALLYDGERPTASLSDALRNATHILASAAPGRSGDPFLRHHERDIANAERLKWIGYLSTVGVYGDHGGQWIDERAMCAPTSERGELRLEAEGRWTALGERLQVPTGIFRLAGIYGPGRNAFVALSQGRARRIKKPGQVFNRIHVEDIGATLEAAIERPASRIYNVTDDEPAAPDEVIAFAATVMGVDPPAEIPFEEADLTPMARSFYGDVKRVSNERIKAELGVSLAYPTYREGLRQLWTDGSWRGEHEDADGS